MRPSAEQVRSAVAQQAGTWFVENQAGSLGHAERAAFVGWLKASPIHVEEYLGVALIAQDLRAATDDPEVSLESLVERARADRSDSVVSLDGQIPLPESPSQRITWPGAWRFATSFAAGVLLLVASVLWWLHDGELLGLPKSYQTAHGEQKTVRLPDGSELDLNTDSTATVRYTDVERVVVIERGEALFTVSHGDSRRFRVTAGLTHVIAVGTRFNVYRKPDTTVVTVAEGTVGVLAGEAPASSTGALPIGAQRVAAGYQLRVDADGVSAQPIPVDLRQALSWREHKIAFERRPLGEVAEEFNRYGSIPIQIQDDALRALPISGVFDAYDTDSFVTFMQTLDGVAVEQTSTGIRVVSPETTTR